MGLFSSKKKVYVASSVYKLIETDDRPTLMAETVAGASITGQNVAQAITNVLTSGPRARQKSFLRWAKQNFDFGLPRAAINYTDVIATSDVEAQIRATDTDIGSDTDKVITVHEAFIDNADESYYAEQWIYANEPARALEDWAADVNLGTGSIDIQYPDSTTDSFMVSGYNSSNTILVAYYSYVDTSPEPDPEAEEGDPPPDPISYATRVLIYELGSGNTNLDSRQVELTDGASAREFYPFIPIRIDNDGVFDSGSPAVGKEDEIREAYERLLGGDIDELIDEVESNADIDDIDYCYLVSGVSLNTSSIPEKEYIFNFFQTLAGQQQIPSSAYQSFQSTNDSLGYHTRTLNHELLNTAATIDPANPGRLLGVDIASSAQAPRVSNVHLTLPSTELGVVDMKITWSDISEETLTGVYDNDVQVGDVRIRKSETYSLTTNLPFTNGERENTSNVTGVIIEKQISGLEFVRITCQGLQHKNLIYDGKSVDITGEEAIADTDTSGFIIPLHEPTLKNCGAVVASEISRESHLLVFNSYQVVKKKWYQSGIFGFVLAVVIAVVVAVITVTTAGAGTPAAALAGSGILGSAAAVGATLGLSGLLAIAVGAAANAIAAMLVLQAVNTVASEAFGAQIGRILTAVTSVLLIIGTGPGGFDFGNIQSNIANMAPLDKLAMMTSAATDIVGAIQEAKLNDIMEATKDITDQYEEEMLNLNELMEEFGDQIIDPLMLTDFTDPLSSTKLFGASFVPPPTFMEDPQAFMDRTLMTGSDLIDLSHAMVTDFVDTTLTLQ